MKVAVLFYSLEGCTEQAATELAHSLSADLIKIELKKPFQRTGFSKFFIGGMQAIFKYKPALNNDFDFILDYDLIFLGSPTWAGLPTPAIRSFLSLKNLLDKPIAYFYTCEGVNPELSEKIQKMIEVNNVFLGSHEIINFIKKPNEEWNQQLIDWAKKAKLSISDTQHFI